MALQNSTLSMDNFTNPSPLQQAINVCGIPPMVDQNMQQEVNTNQFGHLNISGVIRGLASKGVANNLVGEQCDVQQHNNVIVAPRPLQMYNDMNIMITEQPQDDHDYKFR